MKRADDVGYDQRRYRAQQCLSGILGASSLEHCQVLKLGSGSGPGSDERDHVILDANCSKH